MQDRAKKKAERNQQHSFKVRRRTGSRLTGEHLCGHIVVITWSSSGDVFDVCKHNCALVREEFVQGHRKAVSRSAEGRIQGQQEDDDSDAGSTFRAHVTCEPERRHFGPNNAHSHVD